MTRRRARVVAFAGRCVGLLAAAVSITLGVAGLAWLYSPGWVGLGIAVFTGGLAGSAVAALAQVDWQRNVDRQAVS